MRRRLEQTLAGLGKRQFLLHNVNEERPAVFATRWVMSYLAGPLTREQIRTAHGGACRAASRRGSPAAPAPAAPAGAGTRPVLPAAVRQFFVPAGAPAARRVSGWCTNRGSWRRWR